MDAGYGAEVGAMTDRELLERAAKAAGLFYHGARVGPDYQNCYVSRTNDTDDWFVWSPLTDDGDALRLAVKLGFINPGQWPSPGQFALDQWATTGTADWYSATRRAIVSAAAEIGRTK